MKDKKIRPYDGDGFFYSGSDEDYEEFAKRAYEKCGFVEFGRRHEALFQDGKYHDLIYMELINK